MLMFSKKSSPGELHSHSKEHDIASSWYTVLVNTFNLFYALVLRILKSCEIDFFLRKIVLASVEQKEGAIMEHHGVISTFTVNRLQR